MNAFFLTDENFDGHILEGVLHRNPDFDVIRVQDTDIYQAADPAVLAWAAQTERILLTYDTKTLVGFAYDRVEAGLPLPGVIEISRQSLTLGQAVSELLLVDGATEAAEWENQVKYLPLR